MPARKPIDRTAPQLLADGHKAFLDISDWKDIVPFALEDIDLSDDVSSARDRIDLRHYPYLVEPLEQCRIDPKIRREVVVAFPEQMGKTTLEMVAILYNCVYNSLQCIICYPSQDLAVETSTVKFLPLFRKIPQFAEDIDKPFAIRGDRLKLSNALIYWQGAGVKVVSKSAKLVLGDECAVWQCPPNVNNLAELKKRTRSYDECLQLFVSTPSYKESPFWSEFLEGSQGYYTLRCRACGELTMRSCDIHNLQFETTYSEELRLYVPVMGSCRMVCPACRHEHAEDDREWMINNGGYVHKFPDRIATHPSFQCGVLASQLSVHNWDSIAETQLKSGRTAELSDYVSFDNSIRGLPYQERDYNAQSESALSKHYYKPGDLNADDVEAVIISADTQDTFSVCGVMALTRQGNYYLLETARPRYLWLDDDERRIIDAENRRNGRPPECTVLDMLDKEYCGMKPLCLFVDMRGHRSDEVKAFSRVRRNILMYGGTQLKYDLWKPSEGIPKLFLCDARKFQADLIFRLYFQTSRESNYLFLPEDICERDMAEIASFQPDREHRNGSLYENWTPKDQVHDMFDTLKMGLACFRIAPRVFRRDRFAHGEARVLNPAQAERKGPSPRQSAPRNPLRRY